MRSQEGISLGVSWPTGLTASKGHGITYSFLPQVVIVSSKLFYDNLRKGKGIMILYVLYHSLLHSSSLNSSSGVVATTRTKHILTLHSQLGSNRYSL